MAFANKIGYVIKLIGSAEIDENGCVSALVAPRLVSVESQLSGVSGVFNAIMVRGDSLGDVMFYGKGAGKLPTASAIVADVIDAVKHLHTNKWVIWSESENDKMKDPGESVYRYFVRTSDLTLKDKLKDAEVLGNAEGEEIFTTGEMKENEFFQVAKDKCAFIRILP